MTFQEFRATGRDVADIGAEFRDDELLAGRPGRIYCHAFWIARSPNGGWETIIGNQEFQSPTLDIPERQLYRFATDERMLAD